MAYYLELEAIAGRNTSLRNDDTIVILCYHVIMIVQLLQSERVGK